MAKASRTPPDHPPFSHVTTRPQWFPAAVCFVAGVLLLVAFAFFEHVQVSENTTHPTGRNPVGYVGAQAAFWGFKWVGAAAWFAPAFLLWFSYVFLRGVRRLNLTRLLVMVLSILMATVLLALLQETWDLTLDENTFPLGPGGASGSTLYHNIFQPLFDRFGTGFLLGTLYCFSLLFVFTRDVGGELDKFAAGVRAWRAHRAALRLERAEERRLLAERRRAEAEKRKAAAGLPPPTARAATPEAAAERSPATAVAATPSPESGDSAVSVPPPPAPARRGGKSAPAAAAHAPAAEPADAALADVPAPAARPVVPKIIRSGVPANAGAEATAMPPPAPGGVTIVKPEVVKKAAAPTVPVRDEANYQFPPISLLREPAKPAFDSDEEHTKNMADLVRILGEFGVTVTPGEIHVGPVITCYEVVPAAGVRVEKIAGLDKNIALGMRAQSVRILAPIPGKAAVGVEIPNRTPTPVGMRELLESEDWASAKAEIPIALGKDVSGRPLISDLTRMPHLLIAGATGSGKSVCINAIIGSIVYRKSPKDVQLIMVDPKVVELKVFNTLPHMLIPVVTEPKKVPGALKWLLAEMEQRYQIFAKVGVRNIAGFNGRKKSAKPDFPVAGAGTQGGLDGIDPGADDGIEVPEHLSYIVAIIDELADLMMVAPAEIETSIARLAQLARAAGIHLIIATQRPSVNVITGVIKANLPSRIAFQVASQVDSRTILDGKGAETLIGRGDMLFSPPGSSRLVRAQGAFVSDEEIIEIVNALKVNGLPRYRQEVQEQIDRDPEEDPESEEFDPETADDETLLKQAVGVLRSSKRASTSMLQRRLRIGYNRAARIMELMEERGIVGPENGSSPREILIDLDSYQP